MARNIKIEHLPNYTYEDYVQWEGRWELVYGIPYAMSPSPIFNHQRVSNKIASQLENLLEHCDECQVVPAVDWKIAQDTVVCPDIMVVCDRVEGSYPTKPPVMIFEILSPSTVSKDRKLKYELYASQGVKYYVIVDIDTKQADVFHLDHQHYKRIAQTHDEYVDFDINKCQFKFHFAEIWK